MSGIYPAAEPGFWHRLNEAISIAQRPLLEDIEWLIAEHKRERQIESDGHAAHVKLLEADLDALRSVVRMLLPDEHDNHHCLSPDRTSWVRVGMDFDQWPTVREVTPAERAALDALQEDDR